MKTTTRQRELQDVTASFVWDAETRRFEITVCGYTVATLRTLNEVKAFSAMHNDAVAYALPAIAA
jgi:hypothetical protein